MDPLPRADATSISKLDGEGTPDKIKTVLEWVLNTCLFRIYLPTLKAKDWIYDLKSILRVEAIEREDTGVHDKPTKPYFPHHSPSPLLPQPST